MKLLRNIVIASTMMVASALPIGLGGGAAVAVSAQSPQKCQQSTWLDATLCYQINGPNGTYVDGFEGSLTNLGQYPVLALNVTIEYTGEWSNYETITTRWHTTVEAGACDLSWWYIPVEMNVAPGQYTAFIHGYGGTAARLSWVVESEEG